MKITNIRFERVHATWQTAEPLGEGQSARPLDIYPDVPRGSWPVPNGVAQTLTTCPLQEWIFQAGQRDNVFQKHKIEPVNGYIDLPPGPGLGIALDERAIEGREVVQF